MRVIMPSLALFWALLAISHASDQCDNMGVNYCDACVDPELQCYACAVGNVLKADGSGCDACPSNCDVCEYVGNTMLQTSCVNCTTGYILDSTSSVATCNTCGDNCDACTLSGATSVCDTCKTGSYVLSKTDTSKCLACGSNCMTCTADSADVITCSLCVDGYYVKDGGCSRCPSNCLTCSADAAGTETCSVCIDDYKPSTDSESCLPCWTGCGTCTSGDSASDATKAKCSACDDGYYVDNEGCTACDVGDCVKCASSGTCDECDSGFLLEDDTTCTECPFECMTCERNAENALECVTCNDEFTLKESASEVSCDACPSNCDDCTTENAAMDKCTTCAEYYYKDSTSVCQNCPDNCKACSDATTCTAGMCDTGYILDGGLCYKCPADCDASSCVHNTSFIGNSDNTYCDSCDDNFGLNEDQSACIACPTGCPYCVYNTTNTYRCQCRGGSLGDTSMDPRGSCPSDFACDDGYYYDESGSVETCTACSTHAAGCATCNSTVCLTCAAVGYATTPVSGTVCYDCSDVHSACSACSAGGALDSGYTCDTCTTGYQENSDSCTKCGTNCNVCTISGSTTVCTTCKDNDVKYTKDDANTANCKSCHAECIDCAYDTDAVGALCMECGDGYIVNTAGSCDACTEYCDKCDTNSDGNVVCTDGECEDYYGNLPDGTCGACPDYCEACTYDETLSKLICDTCETGYEENSEYCVPCPEDCTGCTITDGTVAASEADDKYYVSADKKSCEPCTSQCTGCTASVCSGCNIGYGLSKDKKECTDCATLTKVTNCALCEDAKSDGNATCTNCTLGNTLSDDASSCLSTTTYGTQCYLAMDKPPACTTCDDSGRALNDDDLCVYRCYACGEHDENYAYNLPYPTPETCNKDDANYTNVEECEARCAIAIIRDDTETVMSAVRGCSGTKAVNMCDQIVAASNEAVCIPDPTLQGDSACLKCFDESLQNTEKLEGASAGMTWMSSTWLLLALLPLPILY